MRKPGTLICWAIFLYAASRLGLSSSKGTSTVSLARVGLKVSTALFTGVLLSRLIGRWRSRAVRAASGGAVVGATGLEPAVSCSQSRRASHYATPRQTAGPGVRPGAACERMTGIEPASSVWKTEALPLSYIRAPSDRAGRPARRAGVMVPQRHARRSRNRGRRRRRAAQRAGAPAAAPGRRCVDSEPVDQPAARRRSKPPRSSRSPWPSSLSMPSAMSRCGSRPGRRCRAAARRRGRCRRATHVELGVGDQAEHRALGLEHRPAAGPGVQLHAPAGGRPCGARSRRCAGRGRGGSAVAKPSLPVLAEQVVVGGRQELARPAARRAGRRTRRRAAAPGAGLARPCRRRRRRPPRADARRSVARRR